MKILSRAAVAAVITILAVAAVACSNAPAAAPDLTATHTATPVADVTRDPTVEPTATATPTPAKAPDLVMVEVPAPIDGVAIDIAESFPPQYFVQILSGLTNGCTRFDRYEVDRDGTTITITVTNLAPSGDVVCTAIYGTVETNVALGSDFEPGQTYTVLVNDVKESFMAQGAAEPPDPVMIEVPAPIDGVAINIAESFPPQYFVHILSGLPSGCARFDRYEVDRDGTTITITVTNLVPSGDVMCTQIYGTAESNVALGSDFEPGQTYTVFVNDVKETFMAQGAAEPPLKTDEVLGTSGKPVDVELGKVLVMDSGDLDVSFLEVIQDSRCPADVVCIRAGDATILIGVVSGGVPFGLFELTTEGERTGLSIHRVGGWAIELIALNPFPGTREAERGDPISARLVVSNVSGAALELTAEPITPTDPGDLDYEVVRVAAPIESVMISVGESFPPQYVVNIVSGLPGGCASFDGFKIGRVDDLITISVINLEPAPDQLIACTKIYGIVQTNVPLGSDFEPDRTYTVVVNGVTETFQAQ